MASRKMSERLDLGEDTRCRAVATRNLREQGVRAKLNMGGPRRILSPAPRPSDLLLQLIATLLLLVVAGFSIYFLTSR